jgi:hypothetical protein
MEMVRGAREEYANIAVKIAVEAEIVRSVKYEAREKKERDAALAVYTQAYD